MEIVTHNGLPFKKVERAAKVCDQFVIYRGGSSFLTRGKVYKIDHFDDHDDPQILDDDGDTHDLYDEMDYFVLEPALGSDPIIVLGVAPPVAKSYTLAITDDLLAEVVAGLAVAGAAYAGTREIIEKVRQS